MKKRLPLVLLLFLLSFPLFAGRDPYSVEVKSFKASSTLPDDSEAKDPLLKKRKIRYSVDKAFDGKPDTVWAEGVDGPGIGETFTFLLNEKILIDEIAVMPGYFDEKLFSANNRIKRFKLETGDKSWSKTFSCYDIQKRQHQKLKSEISTDTLTFTILEVYKGTKWDDTCLSELNFFYKGKKYYLECNRENYNNGKYSLHKVKDSVKILVFSEDHYLFADMSLRSNQILYGKIEPGTQGETYISKGGGEWRFSDNGILHLSFTYRIVKIRMGVEEEYAADKANGKEEDEYVFRRMNVLIVGDASGNYPQWGGNPDFIGIVVDEITEKL